MERNEMKENNEITAIIEVAQEDQRSEGNTHNKNSNTEEKFGGFGEVIGRIFRFIGNVIKKGNVNFFEVRKENEKPIKISLTISVLLVIFLTMPTVILLGIGLFCGYKYSINGEKCNFNGVNSVFDEVSKSAENIKKDFKAGYEK